MKLQLTLALGLFALCLQASAQKETSGDVLQLTDGRFVSGVPMTRTPDGVTIHYENGDVQIPKIMVRDAFTSKVEGVKVKLTAKEQERLAKGEVKFEGKWMTKKRRDGILAKRQKARKRRLEEARAHQKWRDRYRLNTKNFAFEYTISPEKMQEMAVLMETYYKTFTKAWKIKKPMGMGRLKVCFYHDPEYYYQVSGARRGAIGFFRFVPPEELHFYYDRLDERMTIDVMFHETNHYLTHLIDPKFHYPP